jgi:hypothetical protein
MDYKSYFLVSNGIITGWLHFVSVENYLPENLIKKIKQESFEEQLAFQEKREAEKEKLRLEERKQFLIDKYGKDKGIKISNGEIWIGMGLGECIDSKGQLWEIKRDKTRTLVIYVPYSQRNKQPSIVYLFADDTLTYLSNSQDEVLDEHSRLLQSITNVRYNSLVKKYGKTVADKLIKNLIWIGMTKEMFFEVMPKPDDINRTVTAYGVHEQLVYRSRNQYYYFEDSKLTSWQD